jgi:hypothetical protein
MTVDSPMRLAGQYSLKVPFTVCESQGGPYEDRSFVAGVQTGAVLAELGSLSPHVDSVTFMVYPALRRQMELVGMAEGFPVAEFTYWEDDREAWMWVTFRRRADTEDTEDLR